EQVRSDQPVPRESEHPAGGRCGVSTSWPAPGCEYVAGFSRPATNAFGGWLRRATPAGHVLAGFFNTAQMMSAAASAFVYSARCGPSISNTWVHGACWTTSSAFRRGTTESLVLAR